MYFTHHSCLSLIHSLIVNLLCMFSFLFLFVYSRSSIEGVNLTFYQSREESDGGAVSMDVDIGAGKLLIPDRYQMMTGTCVWMGG